jgi:hypothetical protein
MADMDDSLNKISLQDKVKLLDSLKKIRGAEIKEKRAKIAKEIEELEEKRKKEMKALEEQLKKEETELDEEMFKAMDALFFRDKRTYLMNRARVERKQEVVDESGGTAEAGLKGESSLYDISDKLFSGQSIKLQEIVSMNEYGRSKGRVEGMYISPLRSDENPVESSYQRATENKYETAKEGGYAEPNPHNYSSNSKSWLDKLEDDLNSRRNY